MADGSLDPGLARLAATTPIPGPRDPARVMLVTTVKDEGPNILEWVAHHRRVGFTDIVVFQNDSTDTTDLALRELARIGAITYIDNAFRKGGTALAYQNRAYRRAARLPAYGECAWCMALDGDEFLQVNTGAGRVQDLIAALPDADEIRLNWRVFGAGGARRLTQALVSARFTRANAADVAVRHPMPVKTLFRTDAFDRPGIHLPKNPARLGLVTRNGSGRRAEEVVVRGFQITDPEPYRLAQVNHYMVRDAESFLVKSMRGSSSHPERAIALDYWRKRNQNHAEDLALAAQAEATAAAMAELDAASGGRLGRLRLRALRLWRERVRAALDRPGGAALYDALV
jgi:hypothetical protein